jgi:metallo-beta-lactamase family protein
MRRCASSTTCPRADYAEILDWLGVFEVPPQRLYIVHGEPAAADALRLHTAETLGWPCSVPEYLQGDALR